MAIEAIQSEQLWLFIMMYLFILISVNAFLIIRMALIKKSVFIENSKFKSKKLNIYFTIISLLFCMVASLIYWQTAGLDSSLLLFICLLTICQFIYICLRMIFEKINSCMKF